MVNEKEILLLDDNEIANYYNQDIVEDTMMFNNVLVFTNPIDVIDFITRRIEAKRNLPGFFIVDVQMPEMNGFEFLEKIEPILNELTIKPKIYMLTTSSHKRDLESFEQSPLAIGYLNKPLTTDMLLAQLF